MKIILKPEYELTTSEHADIKAMRASCFPEVDITNHYGKQLPTARILVYDNEQLVGHVALLLRMVRINENEVRTMGIQDVCVMSNNRGRGIMTKMMSKAEDLAVSSDCPIMMLFATEPEIYNHLGFESTVVEMQWLKIHEGRNLGTGLEAVEETMIKWLGDKPAKIDSIDMLGHIF